MRSAPLSFVPAGAVLAVAAAADALGAPTAAFYLLLLGIPVSAAAALAALARVVDADERGQTSFIASFEAYLAGALAGVFVLGAAARSPVSLGFGAPGLARAALALGFFVLALQALAALVPVRR